MSRTGIAPNGFCKTIVPITLYNLLVETAWFRLKIINVLTKTDSDAEAMRSPSSPAVQGLTV
jgi:hypothetical protein